MFSAQLRVFAVFLWTFCGGFTQFRVAQISHGRLPRRPPADRPSNRERTTDGDYDLAPRTYSIASRRSGRRTRHHSARLTNPRGGRNLGRPRPPGKQPTHNDWARGRVSAKQMSTVLVSHHRTTFVRPLRASTSTTCPVLRHASAPSGERGTALGHDIPGRTRVAVWRLGECRRPDVGAS